MKNLFIVIFVLGFIIYGFTSKIKMSKDKDETKKALTKTDSITENKYIKTIIDTNEFLNFFASIEKQNILIEYDGMNEPKKPKGKLIDRKYYPFISKFGLNLLDINFSEEKEIHFYAYYKFNISNDNIALIIAYPSIYIGYKVSLFIFNKKETTISKSIELADDWGDMGMSIKYKSWLKDIDNEGTYEIIKSYQYKDFSLDLDGTKNSLSNGIRNDSVFFYKIIKNKIEKVYVVIFTDSLKSENTGFSYKVTKSIKRDTIYFIENKWKVIDAIKYRQ